MTNDHPKEEECTIRTNAQPEPPVTDPMTNKLMYSNGASGGSNLDMCGKCSNNSREALHKRTSAEGIQRTCYKNVANQLFISCINRKDILIIMCNFRLQWRKKQT